jgi:chitin synthase
MPVVITLPGKSFVFMTRRGSLSHSYDSYSPADPSAYGDPYARPSSAMSQSTNGVETAWRRRQTIKRGVTRKVKLTKGNFITEYPVPTPVHSAIEAKYAMTSTTEFS